MHKHIVSFIAALLLGTFALSGCGSDASSTSSNHSTTASSTAGTYKDSDEDFLATVKKDSIEIYMVNDDTKALYWAGTWTDGDTVVSKGDQKRLEASLLGSQNSTKKFQVDGDEITFTLKMMGTTSKVTVEKQS